MKLTKEDKNFYKDPQHKKRAHLVYLMDTYIDLYIELLDKSLVGYAEYVKTKDKSYLDYSDEAIYLLKKIALKGIKEVDEYQKKENIS